MTRIRITVHGTLVSVSRGRAARDVSGKTEDTRAVRGETCDRASGHAAWRTAIPHGTRSLIERYESQASGQRIGKTGIGRRVRTQIRYGYGKGEVGIGMSL